MNINDYNELISTYQCYCKTDAEEAKLIAIIQNGDSGKERAKEEIVKANMYWAGVYARKFQFSKLNVEDIWSYANIGVLQSIDSFDPSKGVPFHKYAEFKMKSCILENIGSYGSEFNLPKQVQIDLERLRKISNELCQETEGESSVSEIAKEMKIGEEYVSYLQSLKIRFQNIDDLYKPTKGEDEGDDESASNEDIAPEVKLTASSTQKQLSFKDILPPFDYDVFVRSRGLDGFQPMTHKEILNDINRIRAKEGKKLKTMEDVSIHYKRAVLLDRCID